MERGPPVVLSFGGGRVKEPRDRLKPPRSQLRLGCTRGAGDRLAATGWLAHTTRAALTGLRKRGFKVAIDRSDNARGSFYRIQTDRSDDANAAAADDDEGRANSAAVRKKSSRSAKPQARRAA